MLNLKSEINGYTIIKRVRESKDENIYLVKSHKTNTLYYMIEVTSKKKISFISSEYTLEVYNIFNYESQAYIVIQYLESSLESIIKRVGALDSKTIQYIFYRVVMALKSIYNSGYEGVRVDSSRIYISSYGEIRFLFYNIDNRTPLEDIYYRAPELFDPLGKRQMLTGVYSFCIVLYEMLTGLKPFMGGVNPSLIRSIKKGRYYNVKKMNPKASTYLSRVCKKGMSRNPNRRFHDIKDIENSIKNEFKTRVNLEPLFREKTSSKNFEEILNSRFIYRAKKRRRVIIFLLSMLLSLKVVFFIFIL